MLCYLIARSIPHMTMAILIMPPLRTTVWEWSGQCILSGEGSWGSDRGAEKPNPDPTTHIRVMMSRDHSRKEFYGALDSEFQHSKTRRMHLIFVNPRVP